MINLEKGYNFKSYKYDDQWEITVTFKTPKEWAPLLHGVLRM